MVQKKRNSPIPSNQEGDIFSTDEVLQQLQRIFESPDFDGTKAQRGFLQYVVSKTIEGKSRDIKAYTVATEVFGRNKDFDQNTDPIVSIQANKLRRALERYYLIRGKHDPIRIDIPKGSYLPVFMEQTGVERNRTACEAENTLSGFDSAWPKLVVRPFQNLTGDSELHYLTTGFTTELAMEITRYQDVRVLMFGPEARGRRVSDSAARFAIDGTIQKEGSKIKVNVQLIDLKTGFQIWGDTHHSDFKANPIITFQEHVARVVTAKIASKYGIISQTLSAESKTKSPTELKTYEAILRFHEYDRTFTPDSLSGTLEALRHAANIEPDCGQIWTMLGRIYSTIHSLDLAGYDKPLHAALGFAQKGVRINPEDQRARATLAFVYFLADESAAALREINRAYVLNPNSLFALDEIGYVMTLLGEWELGTDLIRKAIAINPYCRPIIHQGLWLDWIRREEYEHAYLETMCIDIPGFFWYPLAKASTLGLLGKHEKGEKFAEGLLRIKPDFPGKARKLIGRYVKFDEIVERVIEGLNLAGLRVH